MVHRIHRASPHGRAYAAPPRAPRLSQIFQIMLGIRRFANSGVALVQYPSHLPGRHFHMRVLPLVSQKLNRGTRGSSESSSLAGSTFHIMHECSGGNTFQGEPYSFFHLDTLGNRLYGISFFQPMGGKNVRARSIRVEHPRDMSRAIGVVFDSLYSPGNIEFLLVKIKKTIPPLVAAPPMPHGNSSRAVSPCLALL